MAEISKITLPNGNVYDLKDANAVKRSGDTMTGTLALKGNQYYQANNVSGLNAQNSDLIGINGLYFNDAFDGGGEGINFLRSNGNYDTLRALNGDLQIAYDRASTETGVWSKVHTLKPYGQGTIEPDIRPLVDQTRANRLAFLPADQVIIEKTTDGGTTWIDAGITDGVKQGLFSVGGGIYIPLLNSERSTQCGLRVTITGMKYNVPQGTAETEKYNYWNSNYVVSQERYFNVREWWFWLSSAGDEIRCIIECATGAKSTTWVNRFNTDFGMTGWSGSDWIRTGDGATFGGGTNQTSNYWNWRLTFFSKYQNGKTAFTQTSQQNIAKIRCYGDSVWGTPNSLMYMDHMYSYDVNQNVIFPAKVIANNGFSGNLSGNATSANTATAVATQGNGTTNVYRHIWFSDGSTETKRAHDDDFTYNPALNTLKVANIDGKINNHTINSDVPANAKFTDTTYAASTVSIGSASAGTVIPADDITAWTTNTPTAVTPATVVTSASGATATVTNGVLSITNGSFGTGPAATVTAGTAASLSYTAKSIPNISVSSKTVVTGITAS